MKKINLRNFAVTAFLLLLAGTNLWSIDYPLKKDDTGPGSVSLGVAARSLSRAKVSVAIPVNMSVEGDELGLFFNNAVGDAYVTVEDANGAIVISTVLDTNSALEFYFPVDELEGGTYTLRVQYGSTKLIGEFNL